MTEFIVNRADDVYVGQKRRTGRLGQRRHQKRRLEATVTKSPHGAGTSSQTLALTMRTCIENINGPRRPR
jgi:lactate dehydrogenase-like 2-hydroxyacid dehydrogenase